MAIADLVLGCVSLFNYSCCSSLNEGLTGQDEQKQHRDGRGRVHLCLCEVGQVGGRQQVRSICVVAVHSQVGLHPKLSLQA